MDKLSVIHSLQTRLDGMVFRRNWLLPLGVLGGILRQYAVLPDWLLLILLTILTAGLLLRRQGRFAPLVWLGVLLGGVGVMLSEAHPQSYIANLLQNHPRRAEVRLKITDIAALGMEGDADFAAPPVLTAEIQAVRLDSSGPWRKTSGRVNIRFATPEAAAGLEDGEIIEGGGRFRGPPSRPEFRIWQNGRVRAAPELVDRGWEHYCRARRIAAEFVMDSYRRMSPDDPGGSGRMRQALLQKIDAGIADSGHRALLGALTLGVRSRVSPDMRELFRESGTVHLFSISGLHVGILAMLLLLLLRPMPLVWRAGLLLTLVLYVLLTGGNAPAVRAFLLVLLVWGLRAGAYRLRPLEILGGIGTALLLWNPPFLFDAGFQYSFTITGFLILAAGPAQGIARAAAGPLEWRTDLPRWRREFCRWRGRLAGAGYFALVAMLSGAGLSLYHQHYFFPGSFLVNLLLLTILAPLFLLVFLKCLLPWGNVLWNLGCNGLLDYMEQLLSFARLWTGNSRFLIPSWGGVICYGILLALALRLKNRYARILGWCGVGLWLAWYGFGVNVAPAVAVAATGGSSEYPTLAILYPRTGYAVMLNATREGVYSVREVARHCGITRVAWLGFYPNRGDVVSGLPQLIRQFPVEQFGLPDRTIRSVPFKTALAPCPVHSEDYAVRTARAEGGEAWLRLQSEGVPPITIEAMRQDSGDWRITVNGQAMTIPPGSVPRADLVLLPP